RAGVLGIELAVPGDRPAGVAGGGGDLGEAQRLELAGVLAGRLGVTGLPDHRVLGDAPGLGGAGAELLDAVARRQDRRHAAGEGDAAAVGHVVVAERGRVG